jgi:hypothetical protein
MKKLSTIIAILIIGLTAQAAFAQSQADKDKKAFLINTRILEKKPFDPNANAARQWNFKWVSDTDQVSVVVCGESFKLIPEKKNKFKGELLMQYMFGMAAYKLENPDKKDDENAAQLAGVESMLRTYEVMVAENDKAKNAELDALLVKQKNGELQKAIEAAGCGKK